MQERPPRTAPSSSSPLSLRSPAFALQTTLLDLTGEGCWARADRRFWVVFKAHFEFFFWRASVLGAFARWNVARACYLGREERRPDCVKQLRKPTVLQVQDHLDSIIPEL